MKRKPNPRRGRPPIDNAATETVRLRVTPDVREQWTRAAASAGVTLSEWLREAAELAIARGATR